MKNLINLTILCSLLCGIFSCSKENINEQTSSSKLSLSEVKIWFNSLSNSTNEKFLDGHVPDWKQAKTIGDTLLDIPVLLNGKAVTYKLTQSPNSVGNSTVSTSQSLSALRLVVRRLSTGKLFGLIVKYIPDENSKTPLDDLRYGNISKSAFSGVILINSIEGEFLEGARFSNGRKITDLLLNDNSGSTKARINGGGQICADFYLVTEERWCDTNGNCTPWRIVSVTFIGSTCTSPDIGGNGNGENSPGNGGTPSDFINPSKLGEGDGIKCRSIIFSNTTSNMRTAVINGISLWVWTGAVRRGVSFSITVDAPINVVYPQNTTITEDDARTATAYSIDVASMNVLNNYRTELADGMTGVVKSEFKKDMERLLKTMIPGARVRLGNDYYNNSIPVSNAQYTENPDFRCN